MELKPGDIDLWIAYPDQISDPELLSYYDTLLSPEEKIRKDRFHFLHHRHQYLISRALVRITLSRYAPMPPEKWRFLINDHGRPELAQSAEIPPLRFNLSHTTGIVAMGVALRQDIGVDVEDIERKVSFEPIANRFFTPSEIETLNQVREEDRRIRFFEFWTLKESYSKARGIGLTLPLNRHAFHRSPGGDWSATFDSSLKDDPDQWEFRVFHPTPRYVLAVCLNHVSPPPCQVKVRETVPGQW